MPAGYMGKLLEVDLSLKTSRILELDETSLYNFIGGRGLASKLLYERLRARVNPLSPENELIFMTGPLTGTGFPGSGRICVASKSPLTGTIFPSSMGGSFGVFLKKAGFDGIILRGKAEKLSYLHISDQDVTIHDASHLKGKSTSETEAVLREEYPNASIAEIGPAGENLSPLASISSGGRFAGRGGLGAVMGSKNLKAIVVQGNQKIIPAHPTAFKGILLRVKSVIENHPVCGKEGLLSKFGTAMLVHRITAAGILPVRDFSHERLDFSHVDGFSGETIREKFLVKRSGCFACPTACGRIVKLGERERRGVEYETIAMLGPNSDFWKYEEILELGNLCDELGIDTISTGVLLGYVRKRGMVRNLEEAVGFLHEICGGRVEIPPDLAQVKGLGLPAYDPRGAWGIALAYATSTRGACHLQAYTIGPEILGLPEFVNPSTKIGKARLVKKMQDAFAVLDSLIVCKYYFPAIFTSLEFELDDLADLLTALTGWKWTNEHLHQCGSRIFDIERMFNLREGFGPEHDRLPPRFGLDLSDLLEEYYRERGWKNGIPQPIQLQTPSVAESIPTVESPLSRIHPPELQVALDLDSDLQTILEIAKASYEGGARIIEAGTPIIKRHGIDILLPALRKVCPDAILVADMKTADVGNLEARIAFRKGADLVAVLGMGGNAKIEEALGEAARRGKGILIDLIDCQDPLLRIEELVEKLHGQEERVAFCLHRGISEQMRGRGIYEHTQLIREAKKRTGRFLLFVAGGIKAGVAGEVVRAGADVCIVGSAIYNSADPKESVSRILLEIKRA